MKICVLTHTFPRFKEDTAAPFMDGVARGLVIAGNDVFVLTPYSPLFDFNTARNYELITYKYIWPDFLHKIGYSQTLSNDKKLKLSMYLLSPFMYFFGIIALLRLIWREKIDIISAHWILPNGFIGAVASLITGVPVVSTLPGSDVYMIQKNELFRLMGMFSTKVSKVITSNSPQLLEDLRKITRIKFNSETILYGVDSALFTPDSTKTKKIKKSLNIHPEMLVVLGVGRLVEKKGFEYLIKAASLLKNKIKNVIYVIVGDGDQRQTLENMTIQENLKPLFRFVGTINYLELKHYYNLADVFILPSIRDDKGNLDDQSVAAMEAMACGKPVICTDFPGYRITIKQGENGFLTREADEKGISKLLEKLLKNKTLRERMGEKARVFAVDFFSWAETGKQYTNLFKKM